MSVGMVILSTFIAVLIIAVVWFIIYMYFYNEIRKRRKPTLPYKKSRFGLRGDNIMRSIRDGLIASLILLFIGEFLWILYGDDTIMNTIDNLQ
jgi:TRAP-type mannitol/chloroaromatic compound transport system permease large subunit